MNAQGLKVLMVSNDRNILSPGSAVSLRMKEYGGLVKELHIVLMSDVSHGLSNTQLGDNVGVYPTNARFRWQRPFKAVKIGKEVIRRNGFVNGEALITAQDPFECGLAALKIKKATGLPIEIQLHTDPFSSYFGGFLNSIRKRIAKKVLRHADRIRVVSELLKDKISRRFNITDKIVVLPIFIETKNTTESSKPTPNLREKFGQKKILVAVGRLTEEKNQKLVLEALSRHPETCLALVGDGPLREKLENMAKNLGISERVAFLGWQEDPRGYLKQADIFIQTSQYEGYGLALVEAGLEGLPVISTPVGIANELENGQDLVLCPQGDVQGVSDAISKILGDPEFAKKIGENLKKTLRKKLIMKENYMPLVLNSWEMTASRF